MSTTLQLHILIYKEASDVWIAQVLEKDMAAHGKTPYAALAAVQLVLQAHVNFDTRQQRPAFSRLAEAPPEFWHAFKLARPLPLPHEAPNLPAHIIAAIAQEPPAHVM